MFLRCCQKCNTLSISNSLSTKSTQLDVICSSRAWFHFQNKRMVPEQHCTSLDHFCLQNRHFLPRGAGTLRKRELTRFKHVCNWPAVVGSRSPNFLQKMMNVWLHFFVRTSKDNYYSDKIFFGEVYRHLKPCSVKADNLKATIRAVYFFALPEGVFSVRSLIKIVDKTERKSKFLSSSFPLCLSAHILRCICLRL